MAKRDKSAVLRMKRLWKGHFNRSRELLIKYSTIIGGTLEQSKRRAWVNMCKQIADRDGVFVSHVEAMFDGHLDNFRIMLEKEELAKEKI